MQLKSIGGGHWLNESAADAFLAMCASAIADGINIHVNVSVRPASRQKTLFAQYVKDLARWAREGSVPADKPTPVARPGQSEHDEEKANAVDIAQASDPRILPWMLKHGPSFGFYATARGEKWHWGHYRAPAPKRFLERHAANAAEWSTP